MGDGVLSVHRFSDPLGPDVAAMRRALGGKGLSLAEMGALGLPVPPFFTLATDLFRHVESQGTLPGDLHETLAAPLEALAHATGRRFGDPKAPLLLAVRSGAPSSMPGMLDTVLDVGVDATIARGLSASFSAAQRFGLDVRRRFLEGWGTTVLGIPADAFTALGGRRSAHELDERGLAELLVAYERLMAHEAGAVVPDGPMEQLLGAILGVLRSWRSPRAEKYRVAHGIAADEGTSVTVQAMVYGNVSPRSGAGVLLTRHPLTGAATLHGEWLPEAQGEDVVGGRRTPHPLTRAQVRRGQADLSLETALPEAYAGLTAIAARLEAHYRDAQEIELTIEEGTLYLLQCRPAGRSPGAAARVAVELVEEGRIAQREALARVEPASLRRLLTPHAHDPQRLAAAGITPIARGLAASPGTASGQIVLDVEAARAAGPGAELVLVRAETSPEDVEAMRIVQGIVTAAGGLTSHAAVVARAMGKPCVAGATTLHIDRGRRVLVVKGEGALELKEGAVLTVDGSRGLLYAGEVPVEAAPASPHVTQLLAWADEIRTASVLAEAQSPRAARIGRSFGADGAFVPALLDGAIDALREAVGEGRLVIGVSAAQAADIARSLRPDRDAIFVAPEEIEAARLAAPGIAVWSRGARADVCLLDAPPDTPRPWVHARESPLGSAAVEGAPIALIVEPLDVPAARLLLARG